MMTKIPHQVVCFGEILWDMLPSGPQPGGAPMNVAYHLHKLGYNPAMISRVGIDKNGKDLLDVLQSKKVDTSFVQTDLEVPTGVVLAKQQPSGDMQYEFAAASAWDHIMPTTAAMAVTAGASHFVYGSLAARHRASRDTLFQLLDKAQTKVLDINLRPPHFHRELLEQLLERADILKLNIEELELFTGWYASHLSTENRIRLLRDRFNIHTILVTRGANGSLIHMHEQLYTHPGYRVRVNDTVGSGDAFLAAAISMIIEQTAPDKLLDFANRLAATITTYKGAMPDYDIKEVDSLYI